MKVYRALWLSVCTPLIVVGVSAASFSHPQRSGHGSFSSPWWAPSFRSVQLAGSENDPFDLDRD